MNTMNPGRPPRPPAPKRQDPVMTYAQAARGQRKQGKSAGTPTSQQQARQESQEGLQQKSNHVVHIRESMSTSRPVSVTQPENSSVLTAHLFIPMLFSALKAKLAAIPQANNLPEVKAILSMEQVTLFFGVFIWSCLLAYPAFLMCEAPTAALDKMVFEGLTGRGKHATKEHQPDAHIAVINIGEVASASARVPLSLSAQLTLNDVSAPGFWGFLAFDWELDFDLERFLDLERLFSHAENWGRTPIFCPLLR
ncbi:hypothetical protein HPB51_019087 [Rhipicephalus microplus]|uniref:Uncharacterized protein n=1 Tax=Rhipicephalus microplus TaxID=6941 RepID=A0A9J6EHZ1_RHIMP|nr:hypothetical protein HPB51_019087 [Rhipicephalus microplus]